MNISNKITAELVEQINEQYERTNSHVRIVFLPDRGGLFRNNDVETGDDFDEIDEARLWNRLTVRGINKVFRAADESHLYPVNGKFNATDRAIRHLQKQQREGLCIESPYEYALALEQEISAIVNDPNL